MIFVFMRNLKKLLRKTTSTWDWLVTRFRDKVDIAMYTTRFGDGMYPSIWGLDQNGEPTCLVTDFLIMDLQETYESSWFFYGEIEKYE